MRLDKDRDEQIARRPAVQPGVALAAQIQRLPVVDAGRDLDLDGLILAHGAAAAAARARLVDDLAAAAALLARAAGLHHAERGALRGAHAAGALAVRADLRRRAGGAAGALAVRTLLDAADVDLLLAAERRLFKGDIQAHAQVFAPARAAALALTAAEAAAEDIPEDIPEAAAENVVKAAEAAETGAAGAAGGRVERRMAELVILRALVGIGQHLVGLVDLLEALLAFLIARMQIRVVGLGQLAVGFFDLVLGCTLFDTEHFIIISFFSHT